MNLYAREKTNGASVAAVDVAGEESPHPTIYDLCNAAGQFHQRLGIARSLQPTTEVNTIFDGISFREFILSRPAITDLSTSAEEPPATRARVRHREVQSCS